MFIENVLWKIKVMKIKWFKRYKWMNTLILFVGVILAIVGTVFGEFLGDKWSMAIISAGMALVTSVLLSYTT